MVKIIVDKIEVGTYKGYKYSRYVRSPGIVPDRRAIRVWGHLSHDFFPYWVSMSDKYGGKETLAMFLTAPFTASFEADSVADIQDWQEGDHVITITPTWTPLFVVKAGDPFVVTVNTVGRNDFTF